MILKSIPDDTMMSKVLCWGHIYEKITKFVLQIINVAIILCNSNRSIGNSNLVVMELAPVILSNQSELPVDVLINDFYCNKMYLKIVLIQKTYLCEKVFFISIIVIKLSMQSFKLIKNKFSVDIFCKIPHDLYLLY